jgi:hypothetical protein
LKLLEGAPITTSLKPSPLTSPAQATACPKLAEVSFDSTAPDAPGLMPNGEPR